MGLFDGFEVFDFAALIAVDGNYLANCNGRKGDTALEEVFGLPLMLARRVREQRQNQRGKKVYSLHAPEVECIGKGKAHLPYEFGVKVSIATTLHHSRGGQFIAHAKAMPGNPWSLPSGLTRGTATRLRP